METIHFGRLDDSCMSFNFFQFEREKKIANFKKIHLFNNRSERATTMAYTYIPTTLLTEYATQYDQIILRYRQNASSGGGLLMLSDPAAKSIQVQSLHKKDSAGHPVVFTVKTTNDIRFSVQPHHLKILLAKYEYVNGIPHPMASFPQLSLHVTRGSDDDLHPPTPPRSAPSSPSAIRSTQPQERSSSCTSDDDVTKGRKRKMDDMVIDSSLSDDSDSDHHVATKRLCRASPTLPSQKRVPLEFSVKRTKSL